MYKVGESVACIGIINHFEGNDYWTSIECKNGLKVLCQTRDLIPSPIAKIQDMRESADRLAETLKQASELKWTKGFQFGYKRACEEVLELLGGK